MHINDGNYVRTGFLQGVVAKSSRNFLPNLINVCLQELTENQIEAAKTVGAAFKRADETKLRSLDLYAGW
jgi:hypothetical protein